MSSGQNVAAADFWKARAGWREKHEINVSATAQIDAQLAELTAGELRKTIDHCNSVQGESGPVEE